jgi:hypothetical protein
MTIPTRFHWGSAILILGTFLPTVGCVTPPSPRECLEYGFDTPIQAFQSFVVALRADLPHFEYRCLSPGFKERNGISRGGYLMFRDQLLKDEPLLRFALQRASRDPGKYQLEPGPDGRQALLVVNVSGHSLHVRLSRGSYVTVLGQPEDPLGAAEAWVDQSVGDLEKELWLFPMPSGEALGAQVPHPHRNLDQLISLTVGREWKIEDLYLQDKAEP